MKLELFDANNKSRIIVSGKRKFLQLSFFGSSNLWVIKHTS